MFDGPIFNKPIFSYLEIDVAVVPSVTCNKSIRCKNNSCKATIFVRRGLRGAIIPSITVCHMNLNKRRIR